MFWVKIPCNFLKNHKWNPVFVKTIQNKVTALCMQELQGNSYDSEIYLYREMGSMCFPVTVICTLQGTSVTQGNPAIFTGNKFAVYSIWVHAYFFISWFFWNYDFSALHSPTAAVTCGNCPLSCHWVSI